MSDEKDKRCAFWREGAEAWNGFCTILDDMCSDGMKASCGFRKTKEQHRRDTDRAIQLNRARGNCVNCKYMKTPCKLSTER